MMTTERKLWQPRNRSTLDREKIAAIRDQLRREATAVLQAKTNRWGLIVTLALVGVVVAVAVLVNSQTRLVLVQGKDLEAVKAAVQAVGGEITHELGIIRAVGARMTQKQIQEIEAFGGLRGIHESGQLTVSARATQVQDAGGQAARGGGETGVTTAVLGSGLESGMMQTGAGIGPLAAYYDAITDQVVELPGGPHAASTGTRRSDRRVPGADSADVTAGAGIVVVKAFDAEGQGSHADVIRGIGWVLEHKDAYAIGALELGFQVPSSPHSWNDPLNQAIMAAHEAGIEVEWPGQDAPPLQP